VFPVQREIHFQYLASPAAHIAYRSSADNSIQKFIEIRARMVDGKGEPPLMQIKDEKGESIRQEYVVRVYWDSTPLDPRDQPTTVGTGRPVNMSEDRWDGSLTIAYRVPNEQALGPVNVIFKFDGTRYYAAGEEEDRYNVMAHTMIEPPPIEERTVFRGIDVTLYGTLKIKPEESQYDTQGGDPVVLWDVRVFWAGTEETSETKKVITELDGSFSIKYYVSTTHALGAVPVSFKFDGADIYQPTQSDINYSVKSQTFIFFENQTVMKGVPVDVFIDGVKRLGIAGVLRDDKGDRIGGVPISLKRQRLGTEETLKSNLITGSDGVFVFPYTVRFEDQVGNLTLIASYNGDDRYTSSQNITNYTVRVRTTIERVDLQNEVTRGGALDIQALLYEDWNGAPGYEIKYEIMTIYLDGQAITNNMTDNGGQVSFHSIISSKTQVGIREISLDYNGSSYYLPTSNMTSIFVKGRTLIGFEDVFPNDTLRQKHRLSGRIRLVDDAFTPLQNQTIIIFYTIDKSAIDIENPEIEKDKRDKQVAVGNTDLQGYFGFNVTFTMGENRVGEDQWWTIHLWVKYDGRPVLMPDGEIKSDYTNSTGEKSIKYYIPMRPKIPDTWWILVLGTVAVTSVVMGYALYEINKRRALHGIQTIIRRAADQLVAGNEYAAVIFKAYRRLAANMKRYGYMRRDSETFREFEKAIRIALPIDQKAMNDFLTVLEEARYSQHEMGEADRGRAINALRAVQYSLEKVILTQEQLAILADKAGALPDEAEPEIYVTTADGQKRAVNVDVPTAEATPVASARPGQETTAEK
jgi:5-hydroxyisourate hydrolase-like protein (transthyretin family)